MKTSIYQLITDRILEQLGHGVVPWSKTWTTGLPKSLSTGKEYRGVNILILAMSPYASRYWLSYREAIRQGGHVRKGERATPVVYWKWRTPEEIRKAAKEGKTDRLANCYPFVSAVFNLEQVEGVEPPEDDVPNAKNDRLDTAERLLEVMPSMPEIIHAIDAEPAYSPRLDRVRLPHLSQFKSADEYYSTLFHELIHSTGHVRRLNRFRAIDGDRIERYSFEELVAEFGASFLCAFSGIKNPKCEALQASYIAGWSQAFREDQRMILRAASAAQRAADYVRGKVITDEDTQESTATAE